MTDPMPLRLHRAASIISRSGDPGAGDAQAACAETAARIVQLDFVTSDEVALGVLERLRQRDVAVPRDLSLVTFDDVGPLHLFAPPLTAIRQPVADMAAQAVALLMSHIAGTAPPDQQPVRLPVELVVRGSVTPPRVEQPTRPARSPAKLKEGALP